MDSGVRSGVITKRCLHRKQGSVDGGVDVGEKADDKVETRVGTVHETGFAIEFGEIAIARIAVRINLSADEEGFFGFGNTLSAQLEFAEAAEFDRGRILSGVDQRGLCGHSRRPILTVPRKLHAIGESRVEFRVAPENLRDAEIGSGFFLFHVGHNGEPMEGGEGVRIEARGVFKMSLRGIDVISRHLHLTAKDFEIGRGRLVLEHLEIRDAVGIVTEAKIGFGSGF